MLVVTKGISLEDEYKKDTGIKPEDINKLREWLDTQPHLPKDFITDLDLILAYHSCERSLQVAKQLLDLHYTLKTHLRLLFHNRTVDDSVESTLRKTLLTVLPGKGTDGSAILFGRLIDLNPKNMDVVPLFRAFLMSVELAQWQQGSWGGLSIVFDLAGIGLAHLPRLELQPLQQIFYYMQEALPVKLSGIHLINAPSFMDKLLGILKPFMKSDLLSVLYTHQVGAATLASLVPQSMLPAEAGGLAGTVDELVEYTIKNMRANNDFFEKESKKRVVESLRPGKPKTMSDIFGGIEGSFKKLDID